MIKFKPNTIDKNLIESNSWTFKVIEGHKSNWLIYDNNPDMMLNVDNFSTRFKGTPTFEVAKKFYLQAIAHIESCFITRQSYVNKFIDDLQNEFDGLGFFDPIGLCFGIENSFEIKFYPDNIVVYAFDQWDEQKDFARIYAVLRPLYHKLDMITVVYRKPQENTVNQIVLDTANLING